MKYSIIIPSLNEEILLPQLLKQLSHTELKDEYSYEIILSDGGSKDGTVEMAMPFVDKIKVHTGAVQQNIAFGRNEGASLAEGDILIFINADVRFENVSHFFNYIESFFVNSDYDCMACNVSVFPEEEILSDRIFHCFYNNYFNLLNRMGMGMGRGECQIIRKEIFDKMNGYNCKLAAGEDFDLFRRIRKSGKVLYATDIKVYESPRRYRKFGYLNVTSSWFKNSVWVVLKNKSLSRVWEQVR